jgi:hypothetical protein
VTNPSSASLSRCLSPQDDLRGQTRRRDTSSAADDQSFSSDCYLAALMWEMQSPRHSCRTVQGDQAGNGSSCIAYGVRYKSRYPLLILVASWPMHAWDPGRRSSVACAVESLPRALIASFIEVTTNYVALGDLYFDACISVWRDDQRSYSMGPMSVQHRYPNIPRLHFS